MFSTAALSSLIFRASTEWCLWGDKWCFGHKLTWYEHLMKNTYAIMNITFKHILDLIMVHTLISLSAIICFCIIVYLIISIRGRPSTLNSLEPQQISSNGNSHSVQTHIYMGGSDSTRSDSHGDDSHKGNHHIKQPREYNPNRNDVTDIVM